MLATTMNALMLADMLEKNSIETAVYTARDLSGIGEVFNAKKVNKKLQQGAVVFLSG